LIANYSPILGSDDLQIVQDDFFGRSGQVLILQTQPFLSLSHVNVWIRGVHLEVDLVSTNVSKTSVVEMRG